MTISIEQFGKDHWSVLAYIEDRCVNGKSGLGTLQRNRMRCNKEKHPLLSAGIKWEDRYSKSI